MGLLDLTISQLIRATKQQIIDAIVARLNGMTERALKEFVWEIRGLIIENLKYEESVEVQGQDSPNGQMLRIRETSNLTGKILSKQRQEWTYYEGYPEGKRPPDIYTETLLDANNNVISVRKIKHFLDGRQPKVI